MPRYYTEKDKNKKDRMIALAAQVFSAVAETPVRMARNRTQGGRIRQGVEDWNARNEAYKKRLGL